MSNGETRLIIPRANPIDPYTMGSIARDAGLTPDEFRKVGLKRRAWLGRRHSADTGKFAAGAKRFGLTDKGVDYSIDQYNENILPESVRKRADDLKADIIAGKIVVPDYYKK